MHLVNTNSIFSTICLTWSVRFLGVWAIYSVGERLRCFRGLLRKHHVTASAATADVSAPSCWWGGFILVVERFAATTYNMKMVLDGK